MKLYSTTNIPLLLDPKTRENTSSPESQTNTFLSTLFPSNNNLISSTNTNNSPNSYSPIGKSPIKYPWLSISKIEIKRAILESSTKKALGLDTVDFKVIKAAFKLIPEVFYRLYRTLFRLGYHLKLQREVVGIILKKPNKEDYSNPKAYRVISLLNCLGKVLERIFTTRLSYLVNTSPDLLSNSQVGGRKQRSSIDAVLALTNYIEESRNKGKKITSTILLDIRGAFDYISKEKLLKKIQEKNLLQNLYKWVYYFLTDRKLQLFFNNYLSPLAPISIGVPQGSPISPILFLILVSELVQEEAFQISYIDDFSLSTSSNNPQKNITTLNLAVERLTYLAKELEVTFDTSKTELIHFSTIKKKEKLDYSISIENQVFNPKDQVKQLGLILDRKLSFKPHIEYRLNLAKATFYKYKRLGSTYKGLSFTNLRNLYISCINSLADYSSIIQYKENNPYNILKKFQTLQNQALNTILGTFKGSPSKALEIEAAIPPPDIRFKKQLNSYTIRILTLLKNYLIRLESLKDSRDELASDSEGFTSLNYLKVVPKNRLNSIAGRIKALIPNW